MMKAVNILLLFSAQSVAAGAARPEQLMLLLDDAGRRIGHETSTRAAVYENLVYILSAERAAIIDVTTGADIADHDVVYHRRWQDVPAHAKACAIYLAKKDVANLDSEASMVTSSNKLTQAWRMWEVGLPCPATVYAAGKLGRTWLLNHLDELPFGSPMIIKGVNATRGRDNYLVHDAAQLAKKFAAQPETDFLLQEFIPNDSDYRVLVCGGEVRLVIRRLAAPGKHTNNTSQGGQATLVAARTLPKVVRNDCVRAAQAFGRDVAGVDVVLHKGNGKHYFFEVNRSPQIESGAFISEKAAVLAQYLYEKANA